MGYFSYYLMSFALAYAVRNPAAAALALVFWLCRGFLPDPVVLFRALGRAHKLNGEIQLNPSNLVACRDLARLYLDLKRPRKAIALLEKTRERMAESRRHPQGSRDDAEMLYLLGIARAQAGELQGALDALVGAVAITPDIGRGEPYMIAANVLVRLGRWEEAEDALDRYVDQNQSSIAVYVRLARVRKKRNDESGAKQAISDAKTTWSVLPSFKRRHEWNWYVAALFAFLWL